MNKYSPLFTPFKLKNFILKKSFCPLSNDFKFGN